MLLRKGVYPYSYIDSFDKFKEGLPPIEKFHNDLKDEPCSTEDYQHVQEMWKEFGMQNLGDLCDVYTQSDTLLLADIISEYRTECWTNFELDPLHYYTAPGLAFDSALKLSGAKLEYLKEISMYQFFEQSIRGGVSVISKRFAKANNKHLPDYDPLKPSNYLWYVDANNLYGAGLLEKQPISNFTWSSLTKEDIINYDHNSDIGYFVECDLSIPNNLHDKFNCFPIAAEPLEITEKNASPKSLEIRKKRRERRVIIEAPVDDRLQAGTKHKLSKKGPEPKRRKLVPETFASTKLAPNLLPKHKYICHIRNLKFYLEQGAELDKIHRVLQFKQVG